MGSWLIHNTITALLDWLTKSLLESLNALWLLLSATVFVNPDVTRLPQVIHIAHTGLGVVNICYVLAWLWAGILTMARGTIQATYGPADLIPRLIIGLVAANLSMPLCSTLIQLANALTRALTGEAITAPGSLNQLRTITTNAFTSTADGVATGVLLLVIMVLIEVLIAILLVQWIIRIGVLVVVVGIAPVALGLHGTPHTDAAARLWWRTLLAVLGTVLLQAVALHTTLAVFLDPGSNLSAVGLPGSAGTLMNLFIVICILWAVVKIPALMRRYVTHGRPSAMSMIVRVVLAQQLTRGLRHGLRSRGGSRVAGGNPVDRARPTTLGGVGSRRPAPARWVLSGSPTWSPNPSPRGVRVVRPRPYTRAEIAHGVDLYTRSLKARQAKNSSTSGKEPPS